MANFIPAVPKMSPPTSAGSGSSGGTLPPPPTGSSGSTTLAGTIGSKPTKSRGNNNQIGLGGFHADQGEASVDQVDAHLKGSIINRLTGKESSFSDAKVKLLKQQLFQDTQGQTKRAQDQFRSEAARRGLLRSGLSLGDKGALGIERAGLQAYSRGVTEILLKQAEAEWKDKTDAIAAGQQWTNGMRQYILGKEANQISREQVRATIASAQIAAGASKYAADQGLKGARAAASASRFNAQLDFDLGVARISEDARQFNLSR